MIWGLLSALSAQAAELREGIPLPLPAGTVWQVVNGYNTITHAEGDPHALDLMRLDGPSWGTDVLAPVPGRVMHVDDSCVGIFDQFDVTHLLCHVTAQPGLERGDRVFAGQIVATIAPAYTAENLGFPHLHYALHTRVQNLRLVDTIPFTGPYALEGHELFDTGVTHEHGNRIFESTNARRMAPPDTGYLSPGWNLVSWMEEGSFALADLPEGAVQSVYAYSASTQSFEVYSPEFPAELNTLQSLRYGDGVWMYVARPAGVVWEQTVIARDRRVPLSAGMNLVTWTPAARGLDEAVAGLDGLVAVYAYDATTQRFITNRPGVPHAVNSLRRLQPGDTIWVEMRAAAEWRQWAPGEVAVAVAAFQAWFGSTE